MEKIIIRASKSGDISVKTEGMKGGRCITETEELEQFLGDREELRKTSEFYQGESETVQISQK